MTHSLRWLVYCLLTLLTLALGGMGYLALTYPRVKPAPTLIVEQTPAKHARGAYLAEHVTVCVDCHSERDATRYSAPPVPGTLGKGGEHFGHAVGVPGEIVAGNITPHGIGGWTDGELMRALTDGVTPDGRAMFPLMNYPAYAGLCRRDLESLVVYVRSLPSVESAPPKSTLDFPMNLIVRTLPKVAAPPTECPDPANTVEYGRYLTTVAGCQDCHSRRESGDIIRELAFAGGVLMPTPSGGTVMTKNITPDPSGIGSWSREGFINRFAMYRDPTNLVKVEPGTPSTPMPWSMFAGMTDDDLGAIYDFLRTVAPVKTSAGLQVAGR